jgi:hypothetical protein
VPRVAGVDDDDAQIIRMLPRKWLRWLLKAREDKGMFYCYRACNRQLTGFAGSFWRRFSYCVHGSMTVIKRLPSSPQVQYSTVHMYICTYKRRPCAPSVIRSSGGGSERKSTCAGERSTSIVTLFVNRGVRSAMKRTPFHQGR